jgi:hypothetical protein
MRILPGCDHDKRNTSVVICELAPVCSVVQLHVFTSSDVEEPATQGPKEKDKQLMRNDLQNTTQKLKIEQHESQ